MLHFLDDATRYLFFTGKGGVGKTSLACATAVALADRGERVLLVSTDPASNLGQVFAMEIAENILPVGGVDRLRIMNIDPAAAASAYRERVVGPVRGALPESVVRGIEEQLSGACTTEIASFDQFTRLLTDPQLEADFDFIIFDTAPTGHTLRLLQLPAAWSGFIEENPSGSSCLGPLSGLEAQREQYAAVVKTLGDADQTTMILVARPERSSLVEAARASGELRALGVRGQRLVVNGLFTATASEDPLAIYIERSSRQALDGMPEELRDLPREDVLLLARNLVGLESLRSLAAESPMTVDTDAVPQQIDLDLPALSTLVDEIEKDGRGLILTMGKGGVGKTTLAAAIAVELARRGHHVHLSTTDPAAHIDAAVAGSVDRLVVDRIDPKEETRRYSEHVLSSKGKNLDEAARRLLEEDLKSPCTEEVAVFHAFSHLVREANRRFVVVDTAPTGHTLLLLDQTGAYHREVVRNTSLPPERITTPMMRLQDPNYTKVLIATLPETTPMLEAAELQADLRRAGIEPYAWIINRSLAAARPTDPLLAARAAAETPLIEQIRERHASRCYLVPWLAEEPVGATGLGDIIRGASIVANSSI